MDAAKDMTLGMWIDYIVEWNALHESKEETDEKGQKNTKRYANQSDFDRF